MQIIIVATIFSPAVVKSITTPEVTAKQRSAIQNQQHGKLLSSVIILSENVRRHKTMLTKKKILHLIENKPSSWIHLSCPV